MKRAFLFLAVAAGLCMSGTVLRSQDAAPEGASDAATAPKPTPAPIPPIPSGTALEMLKAIRDSNAKLLEQQAASLQKLDELDKTAQTLKILGRRS
jgi:hypothetical protein